MDAAGGNERTVRCYGCARTVNQLSEEFVEWKVRGTWREDGSLRVGCPDCRSALEAEEEEMAALFAACSRCRTPSPEDNQAWGFARERAEGIFGIRLPQLPHARGPHVACRLFRGGLRRGHCASQVANRGRRCVMSIIALCTSSPHPRAPGPRDTRRKACARRGSLGSDQDTRPTTGVLPARPCTPRSADCDSRRRTEDREPLLAAPHPSKRTTPTSVPPTSLASSAPSNSWQVPPARRARR